MKMNTPTAIFLGLALIAVAIFFRQPSISEVQAGIMDSSSKYVGWQMGNSAAINDVQRDKAYACGWDGCKLMYSFR
jgi:hypothetical protein